MASIHLTTFVAAPIERVFDLSRSIDLHKKSMSKIKEEAVSGVTFGLINIDETVTWKAKVLLKNRYLRVKITEMNRPHSFTDISVSGALKNMKHEHHFKSIQNGTLMIDIFNYSLGYGSLGKFVNSIYVGRFLEKLFEQRNAIIKEYAETDKWKFILQK